MQSVLSTFASAPDVPVLGARRESHLLSWQGESARQIGEAFCLPSKWIVGGPFQGTDTLYA